MNLTAIDAISAMVAPLVLLTVGGLVSNGLLTVFAGLSQRLRELTRVRIELLTGPAGEMLEWSDAVVYAVEHTRSLGRLRDPVRTRVGGWEFDEGYDPARHEARRADWRAGASYFRDLDEAAPRRDLDAAPRARGTDFVGSGPVADIDHDLDSITLHAAHPNHRTPIRYPILGRTKRHLPGHPADQQWTVGCEKLALVWGGLNHAPVHGLSR